MNILGIGGGAMILLAAAGALHYKGRVPRLVAWLLLLVGVGLAGMVVRYAGGDLTGASIEGASIVTVVLVVTAIIFWDEAVKKDNGGPHRVRTPIIAVVLGVCLALTGGTIGRIAKSTSDGVGSAVSSTVDGGK